MIYRKKCPICGKDFPSNRGRKLTCSVECEKQRIHNYNVNYHKLHKKQQKIKESIVSEQANNVFNSEISSNSLSLFNYDIKFIRKSLNILLPLSIIMNIFFLIVLVAFLYIIINLV